MNNVNLALVLYRQQSPLSRMRNLNDSENVHSVMLYDGIVNGTDAFSKHFTVIIADVGHTNAKQQLQFFKFYKDHSLKNTAFIVLHDETSTKRLIPELREEATILLPHPVYESRIMEIALDSLHKFRNDLSGDKIKDKKQTETTFALQSMEKGEFSFKNLEDAKTLATMLSTLCPNDSEAEIGLLELMINCIEHGNLEITFDEKGSLLEEGKWHQEVEFRLAQPKYSYRNAHIQFERKSSKIEFVISDEGAGFDVHRYLPGGQETNSEDGNLFCFHGRGIKLAAEVCFDHLEYLGSGNQVKATIDL